MRNYLALIALVFTSWTHAFPVSIEPDDYLAGTDISQVSQYVTLTQGGAPVVATACCAHDTAPTGNNTFGNRYAFFPTLNPFDPNLGMFVAEFHQPAKNISFHANFDSTIFRTFVAQWIMYDDAGNMLHDTLGSAGPVAGQSSFTINIADDPRLRYLVIGGYDSIAALRIDRMTFNVPEPSTAILFGMGAVAMAMGRRRKNKTPI